MEKLSIGDLVLVEYNETYSYPKLLTGPITGLTHDMVCVQLWQTKSPVWVKLHRSILGKIFGSNEYIFHGKVQKK